MSGTGAVEAPPDMVRARLAASALRHTVAEALMAAEEAAGRMRTSLALFGVDGADAPTAGVSLVPEQIWTGQEGPHLVGYRGEHALLVTIRTLPALGPAVNAALRAGGADAVLHGLDFTLSAGAALRGRARELAWVDARQRAEHLSRLSGRRLGDVVEVVEAPPTGTPAAPVAAREVATAAVIDPVPVGVQVTLTVRWELL